MSKKNLVESVIQLYVCMSVCITLLLLLLLLFNNYFFIFNYLLVEWE